jgi:magnesium transporter
MVRRGHAALVVADDERRLLGIVTPHRMMQVLLGEHEEDMSRLAGVVHDTEQVRSATIESVPRRVAHRLPWLLVGLVGATLAAMIVSGFEQQLSASVVVAFFLPGVVYMADAVGTQTETVVVRGLSVGVPIRKVAPKEALTGLIIGTLVAVLSVPLGLLVLPDLHLVLAVAVALFVSSAAASVVAMGLPSLLSRAGFDPAYGSGPLSTVIQDLLTLLCYFAIVTAVV